MVEPRRAAGRRRGTGRTGTGRSRRTSRVNPGAAKQFNGFDDNCDGVIDEGLAGVGLTVELVWDSPFDPDPADADGTNLDLLLAHENEAWGGEAWIVSGDQPAGTWDWGVEGDASDDPSVVAADEDGLGPEIITLGVIEPDVSYRIGVHYASDGGFGDSQATLRVYLDSILVNEAQTRLAPDQSWHVAQVDPGGTVDGVDAVFY